MVTGRSSWAAALVVGLAVGTAAPAARAGHAIEEAQAWADWVDELVRGPRDIAQPGAGLASHGLESWALGEADADDVDPTPVVSLGDGGFITLGFDTPIGDGPGDDFAVFENGFWTVEGLFGELAFVEVSSNGVDFARLPAESLEVSPVPGFGSILPALYTNLAGTEAAGTGTGFDLADLAGHPLVTGGLLDLQDVAFVRLVDVIGDGSTFDAFANPVYDPYPNPIESAGGGFDVDAVAVLNVPEPGHATALAAGLLALAALARRRA